MSCVERGAGTGVAELQPLPILRSAMRSPSGQPLGRAPAVVHALVEPTQTFSESVAQPRHAQELCAHDVQSVLLTQQTTEAYREDSPTGARADGASQEEASGVPSHQADKPTNEPQCTSVTHNTPEKLRACTSQQTGEGETTTSACDVTSTAASSYGDGPASTHRPAVGGSIESPFGRSPFPLARPPNLHAADTGRPPLRDEHCTDISCAESPGAPSGALPHEQQREATPSCAVPPSLLPTPDDRLGSGDDASSGPFQPSSLTSSTFTGQLATSGPSLGVSPAGFAGTNVYANDPLCPASCPFPLHECADDSLVKDKTAANSVDGTLLGGVSSSPCPMQDVIACDTVRRDSAPHSRTFPKHLRTMSATTGSEGKPHIAESVASSKEHLMHALLTARPAIGTTLNRPHLGCEPASLAASPTMPSSCTSSAGEVSPSPQFSSYYSLYHAMNGSSAQDGNGSALPAATSHRASECSSASLLCGQAAAGMLKAQQMQELHDFLMEPNRNDSIDVSQDAGDPCEAASTTMPPHCSRDISAGGRQPASASAVPDNAAEWCADAPDGTTASPANGADVSARTSANLLRHGIAQDGMGVAQAHARSASLLQPSSTTSAGTATTLTNSARTLASRSDVSATAIHEDIGLGTTDRHGQPFLPIAALLAQMPLTPIEEKEIEKTEALLGRCRRYSRYLSSPGLRTDGPPEAKTDGDTRTSGVLYSVHHSRTTSATGSSESGVAYSRAAAYPAAGKKDVSCRGHPAGRVTGLEDVLSECQFLSTADVLAAVEGCSRQDLQEARARVKLHEASGGTCSDYLKQSLEPYAADEQSSSRSILAADLSSGTASVLSGTVAHADPVGPLPCTAPDQNCTTALVSVGGLSAFDAFALAAAMTDAALQQQGGTSLPLSSVPDPVVQTAAALAPVALTEKAVERQANMPCSQVPAITADMQNSMAALYPSDASSVQGHPAASPPVTEPPDGGTSPPRLSRPQGLCTPPHSSVASAGSLANARTGMKSTASRGSFSLELPPLCPSSPASTAASSASPGQPPRSLPFPASPSLMRAPCFVYSPLSGARVPGGSAAGGVEASDCPDFDPLEHKVCGGEALLDVEAVAVPPTAVLPYACTSGAGASNDRVPCGTKSLAGTEQGLWTGVTTQSCASTADESFDDVSAAHAKGNANASSQACRSLAVSASSGCGSYAEACADENRVPDPLSMRTRQSNAPGMDDEGCAGHPGQRTATHRKVCVTFPAKKSSHVLTLTTTRHQWTGPGVLYSAAGESVSQASSAPTAVCEGRDAANASTSTESGCWCTTTSVMRCRPMGSELNYPSHLAQWAFECGKIRAFLCPSTETEVPT